MRAIRIVVAALLLSLACIGTYVVNAGIGQAARRTALEHAQAQSLDTLQRSLQAQVGAPLPKTSELEAVVRKALDRLKNQQYEAFYEALPVWRRERVALEQARAHKMMAEDQTTTSEAYARRFAAQDPGNFLKLADKQSFLNLTRAQFFCYSSGLLRIQGDANALRALKGDWFMVAVRVGMVADYSLSAAEVHVLQNGAVVVFENLDGNRIVFTLYALDNSWVVTEYMVDLGSIRVRSTVVTEPALAEAMTAEARAALGTIKDRFRAKYIQNDNTVNPNWTLSDLVNTAELAGRYYGSDDYLLVGKIRESNTVFRALANTATGAPQVTLTVTSVQTGAGTVTSP